jgi:hypothetical protein
MLVYQGHSLAAVLVAGLHSCAAVGDCSRVVGVLQQGCCHACVTCKAQGIVGLPVAVVWFRLCRCTPPCCCCLALDASVQHMCLRSPAFDFANQVIQLAADYLCWRVRSLCTTGLGEVRSAVSWFCMTWRPVMCCAVLAGSLCFASSHSALQC